MSNAERVVILAALCLAVSGCGGGARVVRAGGARCEQLSRESTRAAVKSARRARLVVACARARGELRSLERALRAQPATAGRDHVLGLVLATGPSPGWAEAQRLLQTAFAARPEVPEHGLRLGLFLLETERWRDGVAPLEAAVEADPANTGARVALAGALLECGRAEQVRDVLTPVARNRPSRRDVVRARAILRRATEGAAVVPERARRMLGEITALLGTDEDAARALDLVRTALAAYPDVAAIHAVAALAHGRLGNGAEAVAALLRAAELEPGAAVHHHRLGELYLDMSQTERAREELHTAVELDPFDLDAHAALGDIAYRQQQWGEAAARWRTVASLDGGSPSTLLKLGRALIAAQRWTDAARVYERLLARGEDSYEAYVRLGEIHVQRRLRARDADESEAHARLARELLQKALRVRPQDPLVRRLLGDLERADR